VVLAVLVLALAVAPVALADDTIGITITVETGQILEVVGDDIVLNIGLPETPGERWTVKAGRLTGTFGLYYTTLVETDKTISLWAELENYEGLPRGFSITLTPNIDSNSITGVAGAGNPDGATLKVDDSGSILTGDLVSGIKSCYTGRYQEGETAAVRVEYIVSLDEVTIIEGRQYGATLAFILGEWY
ncbi:MAG: hypothetical protein WAP75_06365, partial [Bacillota bacterium]